MAIAIHKKKEVLTDSFVSVPTASSAMDISGGDETADIL
jgi:hypothetical protein